MATSPANMAVREKRRRSTPLAIEQVNIMKALTAAEYSRRQFILNYAASRETRLLIPGQKADVIKEAEEWVVVWLNQNGFTTVSNEFFKFAVDERLWIAWVGDDVPFPFAFMRRTLEASEPSRRAQTPPETRTKTKSEGFVDLAANGVEVRVFEKGPQPEAELATAPVQHRPKKHHHHQHHHQHHHRSSSSSSSSGGGGGGSQKGLQQEDSAPLKKAHTAPVKSSKGHPLPAVAEVPGAMESDMGQKRSLSLNSIDDIKLGRKQVGGSGNRGGDGGGLDRKPFLARLGKSWARRMS
ncbi:hypothetical protein B0T17DRAFT_254859 [Bombardia bombarda]|uniref:Uncharacterized protein n=1 Tax=Bombardia bombarda TaxID=252184 RepID=A0AA40C4W5_9PEZI|nr:hypothetical protein B0T17DRAFT_254859 [Bombardia bombarda]